MKYSYTLGEPSTVADNRDVKMPGFWKGQRFSFLQVQAVSPTRIKERNGVLLHSLLTTHQRLCGPQGSHGVMDLSDVSQEPTLQRFIKPSHAFTPVHTMGRDNLM